MSELRYERDLREWVAARGGGWERLTYPRPAAGGHTVAYRLTPPAPPRALLLAVHGAGNDALYGLVGLFKACLLRRVQVFSFDVDGHGRGSTTVLAPGAVTDSVAEALRRSGAREAGLPVHALGVSFGGALLLHALPGLQDAIASATLAVAPLRIEFSLPAVLNELRPAILAAAWREREHYGWLGLVPSFGPVKRGAYPLRLDRPQPGAFGYVRRLNEMLDGLRLEEAARRVEIPVALVYGARDRLVPPRQGERLRSLLPASELLRVERGTHLTTPLDPAAESRVLELLEGAASGSGAAP